MKEFKRQLLALAEATEDRISWECTGRASGRARHADIRRLKDFVLVLPEMVTQIRAWMAEAEKHPNLKALHNFMVGYLYHPAESSADQQDGLFAYLDDAYLVGSIYEWVLNRLRPAERHLLPELEGINRQIGYWLRLTRRLLPRDADRIDGLLGHVTRADSERLHELNEPIISAIPVA